MRTTEMEIEGEIKTVQIFDSMWEYIQHYGATVEDYQLSPASFEGERKVGCFKPIDDVFFGTASADMVDIEGVYYSHVNWGEDEYALVPESDLEAEFWLVWEWNEKLSGYDTRGAIYKSKEEAEKEMHFLLN